MDLLEYQDRVIRRNPPLCDGTPRAETGWRAYLRYAVRRDEGPVASDRDMWPNPHNLYAASPLLATESAAAEWHYSGCEVTR